MHRNTRVFRDDRMHQSRKPSPAPSVMRIVQPAPVIYAPISFQDSYLVGVLASRASGRIFRFFFLFFFSRNSLSK